MNDDERDAFRSDLARLRYLINPNTCGNDGQSDWLHDRLQAGGLTSNIEYAEKLAGVINSFRLDCHDCLNAACPSRDPNCPVEEVQERAKQFEKAEK